MSIFLLHSVFAEGTDEAVTPRVLLEMIFRRRSMLCGYFDYTVWGYALDVDGSLRGLKHFAYPLDEFWILHRVYVRDDAFFRF